MSRWSERWWPSARKDDGFSLVEVVVALGILMVLVTSLLPQLVVGIRSTSTARLVTQAKGMAQAELESMRSLPYYVSRDAGDFRDVLDYYYKNLTGPTAPTIKCEENSKFLPPQPEWAGYVTGAAARCSYEPKDGAFYRTVRKVPAAKGISAFTIVTSTQFLSDSIPLAAVTPPTGYNNQSAVAGEPASAQIGVTVTVLYTDRASLRPTSMSTQIARQPPITTRVRAQAAATAIDIGSTTPDGVAVSLTAGLLNLTGSLTHSSKVVARLAAISAGLGTGETGGGSSGTAAAPPSSVAGSDASDPGSLGLSGCNLACWGRARVDIPAVSSANALPLIAPAASLLTDKADNKGFSFGNDPVAGYRDDWRLDPKEPLVRLDPDSVWASSGVTDACAASGSGTNSFVTATGYLTTTATGVETCAVSRASAVSLFPTTFAPRGVVLIELSAAAVRCRVSEKVATAKSEYNAVIKYWDGKGYKEAAFLTSSTAVDPLSKINLTETATGGGKMLGDYISSWSGLTKSDVTVSVVPAVAGKPAEAQVKVPGVIRLLTRPTRKDATGTTGDPESVISLTVGDLNCSAMDAR